MIPQKEFICYHGKYLEPHNDHAIEMLSHVNHGDVIILEDKTPRDLKFHRAYFGLLKFIYRSLTPNFRESLPESKFYIFIKDLRGDYMETKVGSRTIKEYKSISFSKMSQSDFVEYVAKQLPFIYDNIIYPLYDNNKEYADKIIADIEKEWEGFLSKLP